MSAIFPDGRAASLAMGKARRSRDSLSYAECLRFRDMAIVIFRDLAGLSVPETARVLSMGAISERQVRGRRKATPIAARDVMAAMASRAKGATDAS